MGTSLASRPGGLSYRDVARIETGKARRQEDIETGRQKSRPGGLSYGDIACIETWRARRFLSAARGVILEPTLEKIMRLIYELIPDHELLLNLSPEELAGPLFECLKSLSETPQGRKKLDHQFVSSDQMVAKYPQQHKADIKDALLEAWRWLEREVLVVSRPDGGIFISRQGQNLGNAADVKTYRQAKLLPKQLLHPAIATEVWYAFSRGNYGTAVLLAFKEVEVAVRDAGGYSDTDYGVHLMRQAFHAQRGPLTDANQPPAEKDATHQLFAGAIGLYKNPHSHRNVSVAADEAAELIIFASHLLRIIDSRAPLSTTP